MRILQLCPSMHRMGTWFRCFYLSRALVKRGHQVTLVKTSPDSRFFVRRSEEDGVRLVETPRLVGGRLSHNNTRLPSDLVARFAFVMRERFDVVHTYGHHFNTMLPGLVARRLLRRGALVTDWDDLWTEGGIYGDRPERGLAAKLNYAVDHWSEVNLKRYADTVTVVSDDLRARAVAHRVPADRIVFLPNGAPVDVIRPLPKEPIRRELELPRDRTVLIFSGYGQFDIDMVLDAARLLLKRGVTVFTVITGPREAEVSEEVRHRGIDAVVRVAGMVPYDTLCKYLAAADVGLIPYADKPLNRARWPIKLGDYLAAGLVIATCNVGEMGRIVRECGVGVASAPNAEAFANGIEQLVVQRTNDLMSKRARAAAERMSWDALARDLESVYERTIMRVRRR